MNHYIPVQILNFKAFTDILLVGVELIFAIKRFIWNFDRLFNRIRVETSFLGIGRIVSKNKW